MNNLLTERCNLLAENRNAVYKEFKWNNSLLAVASAMVFTNAGITADVEKMRTCKQLLKQDKSIFSDFRGIAELMVLSKMATSPEPGACLENLTDIYKTLHKNRVLGGSYLVASALTVYDSCKPSEYSAAAEKTKDIMKAMKARHPWLTSDSDLAFASLMAVSPKSVNRLIDECEACFEILKKSFPYHKNAVQSLSQVLTVCNGDAQRKCDRVTEIFNALQNRKLKYGKEYELAALGVFANTNISADLLADEIGEAFNLLKEFKGFGSLSMTKYQRLMFASMLAAGIYTDSSEIADTAAFNSLLTAITAQQAAMAAAVTSSSAAANNS